MAGSEWVSVHGGGRVGRGAGEPRPSGSILSKSIHRVRRRLIAHPVEIRGALEAGQEGEPCEARRAAVPVANAGHGRPVNYRWRHTVIRTLLVCGVDVSTVAELIGLARW